MKITEIKKYPLSHDGRISLYIEVCTDNGLKGLGEVGVPNMGKTVISAIEHLEKRLIGEDPWESEKLWQIMFRGNFFPPGVILFICNCRNRYCTLGFESKVSRYASI